MPKRLTDLTDEQRAAMPAHAQRWIEVGWRTGEADWAAFENAIQRCYRYTGHPWPGRVVRVPSPLVGALAAPVAAYRLSERGPYTVPRSVSGAIRESVGSVMYRSVRALRTEVQLAVSDPVEGAVDNPVGGAVLAAVIRGMDDALVGDVLTGGVQDAVRDAVRHRAGGAVAPATVWSGLPKPVRALWSCQEGGQHRLALTASITFFRAIGLELDGDFGDRDQAFGEASSAAGWWWPLRDFVMVADRPRVLRLEQAGPAGRRSHRLHCDTGPALAWPDGWALYYWHGTPVPADLIERGWGVERIFAEDNVEIRRCAIERLGWDRFIAAAGLRQVGPAAPDPGNPGQSLVLYDLPDRLFRRPARVLLCTNGTPERDGTRRRYGLLVPPDVNDPVAAAAWTYGWPEPTYQALARRA